MSGVHHGDDTSLCAGRYNGLRKPRSVIDIARLLASILVDGSFTPCPMLFGRNQDGKSKRPMPTTNLNIPCIAPCRRICCNPPSLTPSSSFMAAQDRACPAFALRASVLALAACGLFVSAPASRDMFQQPQLHKRSTQNVLGTTGETMRWPSLPPWLVSHIIVGTSKPPLR